MTPLHAILIDVNGFTKNIILDKVYFEYKVPLLSTPNLGVNPSETLPPHVKDSYILFRLASKENNVCIFTEVYRC